MISTLVEFRIYLVCDKRFVFVRNRKPIRHCVSKNEPTLTICCFNKHGLILIIFGKQHQHTFKNDMHI